VKDVADLDAPPEQILVACVLPVEAAAGSILKWSPASAARLGSILRKNHELHSHMRRIN
jgi:hypothetical protein